MRNFEGERGMGTGEEGERELRGYSI
jgi:hypothetical protein